MWSSWCFFARKCLLIVKEHVHRKKCVIVWSFSPDCSALLKLKWVNIFGNSCFIHRERVLTKLELSFSWSNFSLSVKLMFAALWQGSATDIMINDVLMTLQTYLHAWMCLNALNVLNTKDLFSFFSSKTSWLLWCTNTGCYKTSSHLL